MERLPRLVELERHRLATIEIADDPSRDAERGRGGLCVVVGYSRYTGGQIGAAHDGRVIGDDHAFLAMDLPDAGDDSGGDDVLAIEAVTGELRELEEGRAEVEQGAHAIARQELAACEMTLPRLGPTALLDALHLPLQIIDELPHRRGVALELLRSRVDR